MPAIDAAFIVSIVVVALVARVAMTGRPYQIGAPALAVGIGMLSGILGLAIIWAVAVRARWQSRLPVLLVAWAFAWAVPLAVARLRGYEAGQIWELTIAEVAMFACLAALLRLGQACSPPSELSNNGVCRNRPHRGILCRRILAYRNIKTRRRAS